MDPVSFFLVGPANEGRGPETQRSPGARSWKDGTAEARRESQRLARQSVFLPMPPPLCHPKSLLRRLAPPPGLDPQGVAFGKGDLKRRDQGASSQQTSPLWCGYVPKRRSERNVRRGTGEMDLCSLGW